MRPPGYLRSEGAGEDSSLTSSLRLSSELFLTALGERRTEIRTRLTVDLFGRLGTFGLNIVKTKADRKKGPPPQVAGNFPRLPGVYSFAR